MLIINNSVELIRPVNGSRDKHAILLYSQTFTQLNEHCDWLILGHVPLTKFKCIPTRAGLFESRLTLTQG